MSNKPQNAAEVQSVGEEAQESFRALIRAIAPETNTPDARDTVDKLAQKLSELVGPDTGVNPAHTYNERGELLNEEGLPVIEITENVEDDYNLGKSQSMPPPVSVEPLIPLAQLPSDLRQRLREQRDRILDQLEEEERQAELAAETKAEEEREDLLRKRREQASNEAGRKKAARDLQKKMGRALIQNLNKDKEEKQKEQEAQQLRDEEADKRRKSPTIEKKTVAFADSVTEVGETDSTALDWGDITPARLKPSKRPTLLSQALLDRHPMKLNVVERVPGGQQALPASPYPPAPDSDDESVEASSEDLSDDEEGEIDRELDQDETDLNFAALQRDITLEYYKKRNVIGQAAAEAMMNHSHEDEDFETGIPSGSGESSKPHISQFRASRAAAAYNASIPNTSINQPPTSLGDSVLPASATRTIQQSVKTGKLDDDNRLVGGEDSGSEDEAVQEILDLLRKGEVYNLGPDGQHLHYVSQKPEDTPTTSSSTAPPPENDTKPGPDLPPPSMRTKTSRFKASRSAAGRPNQPEPSPLSPSATPISTNPRSSPKTTSPTGQSVFERKPPAAARNLTPPQVITSPSFPMVVDSPSFPKPAGSSSFPMIVDSPSFQPPRGFPNVTHTSSHPSRRPENPPPVLSSKVVEAKKREPPK